MTVTALLPEVDTDHFHARRTGRHVEHDPASWNYKAAEAKQLRSVIHDRRCPPFNQGNLGSCTGNAMAGLLMTDPFWHPGLALTEADAVSIYKLGTVKDEFDGAYPPHDTGSSGLGVARAAKSLGYITSYRHAFGIDAALRALVLRPVITGVPWYSSFDHPGPGGLVELGGTIRGGHEFVVVQIDVEDETVGAWNSWGPQWGDRGMFKFSFDTWDQLLRQQGDVMTVHGG